MSAATTTTTTTTGAAAAPSWNLRRLCENRILREVIDAARRKAGRDSWLVLVVDPHTLRIVGNCMRMFDLMEQYVSVVENVLKQRQPLRALEAVYLLSPTEASVAAFLKDCGDGKSAPLYRAAHLFFTQHVPDALFAQIKASERARAFVHSFVELELDFAVRESRVFSTESRAALYHLYSPQTPDAEAYCVALANQLATVCVSMRAVPLVRYEAAGTTRSGLNVPRTIGVHLLAALERLRAGGAFVPSGPPVTLLLLGRTLDPVAPILCEFTYQAMAQHLLPIKRDHYTYTYEGSRKQVVLDDCEDLWLRLRHQHIADCIMQLIDEFNQFMKANRAGRAAAEGTKKAAATLKDMVSIVRAMPEYFEMLSKYVTHMTIAGNCMAEFNKRRLADMAAIEQDLATGFDAQGNEPKTIMNRLPPFLEDPAVSVEDKVRLLMLFIIAQDGMKDADRQRMMKYAKLAEGDQATIGNLAYLGVTLTKKVIRDKKKKQQQKKKPPPLADEVPYELSRFVPRIKGVLQSLIAGDLSETDFPVLAADGKASSAGAGAAVGAAADDKQRRKKTLKTAPKWADKNKAAGGLGGGAGGAGAGGLGQDYDYVGAADTDPRFVVFVAGGMTYSESRSVYEVASATGRNCYIGSTQFFTPSTFVQELSLLDKTPDEAERMEKVFEDQQDPAKQDSKQKPQPAGGEVSSTSASPSSSTTTTTGATSGAAAKKGE